MIPQHPHWLGALHVHCLVDDEHVVVHRDRAFHRYRHGEEPAHQAEGAVFPLRLPGRERRLAMEAVLHALEGAAGAAVGKQQRPAAGVAREPGELVRRRCRYVGHTHRVPGRPAQDRRTQAPMSDGKNHTADQRVDDDAERPALEHHRIVLPCVGHGRVLYLRVPAIRPRTKYLWNAI